MPANRYAEKIRLAMKTKNNSMKKPLTIREVANLVGYSYEHLRKLYNGEPVVSEDLNLVLCGILNLDPTEMWRLSQTEKVTRRLGSGFFHALPTDKRLLELWPKLTPDHRDRIVRIAEGFVTLTESESAIASK